MEYLYHDCHAALNELSGFNGRKGKDIGIGVSLMQYQSIILPRRFELDAFDLELLEDQDLTGGNVKTHEQIMLPEVRDKDTDMHGLVHQENIPFSEVYSTAHTPTKDVLSPYSMDKGFPISRSINMNISFTTQRTLWGNGFSLDDRMDPMMLDDAEVEQMYNKPSKEDPNSDFIGVTKEMEFDSLMNPSTVRSHSSPCLEMLDGARFCLEDHLDPLVLDEAENGNINDNDKPSDEIIVTSLLERIQDMDFSSVACPSTRGSLGVVDMLEHLPSFKRSSEAGKGQHCDEPSPIEHEFVEENVEHLSTRLSFQGDEPHSVDLVDKGQPVVANKINLLRVITPEIKNDQQICGFPTSIATPGSELPGIGRLDVTNIPTPAARERTKITNKKRKILYDLPTILSNKVMKNWLEDPSDIKRHKREVPLNLLKSWGICKHADISQRLFEPCVSGISMDLTSLQCERSCTSTINSMELSLSEDAVKFPGTIDKVCEQTPDTISPVTTNRVCEQTPDIRSTITQRSPAQSRTISPVTTNRIREQTPDIGSMITQRSPAQSPIAPGTPLMRSNSFRPHGIETFIDSDFLEPATSFDSMEKCPSPSEGPELDVVFQEETEYCSGEFLEKDTYSARTRMTASYLRRKFLAKMRKEKKEVLSTSHLLEGKTKKESARLFYEILVLKTRDCIDVAQEKAYEDILMWETCKLKLVSE